MAKNWVLILMMVLVALQSLSVIADVLPLHPSDAEHVHHGETPGGHTHASQVDPLESDRDHPAHPDDADHCHTAHCHGSHMLLIAQPYALNLLVPVLNVFSPLINSSSAFITAILRPPIA